MSNQAGRCQPHLQTIYSSVFSDRVFPKPSYNRPLRAHQLLIDANQDAHLQHVIRPDIDAKSYLKDAPDGCYVLQHKINEHKNCFLLSYRKNGETDQVKVFVEGKTGELKELGTKILSQLIKHIADESGGILACEDIYYGWKHFKSNEPILTKDPGFCKLSRRTHIDLHQSIYVTSEGEIYRQNHRHTLTGEEISPDKGQLGKGGFKIAYELSSTKVRGKFMKPLESDFSRRIQDICQALQNTDGVAVGLYQRYKNSKGEYKSMIIMEKFDEDGRDYCNTEPVFNDTARLNERIQNYKELVIGLINIHKKNIAHLDIKPENFLVKNGKFYVADFDLALRKQDFTGLEYTHGTSVYMDPIFFREETDSKGKTKYYKKNGVSSFEAAVQADIFSMGVSLFEMEFGQRPSALKTEDKTYDINGVKKVRTYRRQKWDHLDPLFNEMIKCKKGSLAIGMIFSQMMDPTPSRRPSLDTVLNALDQILNPILPPL